MSGNTSPLHLHFDRGTLLLDALGQEVPRGRHGAAGTLPGLVWDPRTLQFRAPACRYAEVVTAARERELGVEDHVFAPRVGLPAPLLRAPALRPYQAAAVASFVANEERGVLVMPTGSGKTHVGMALAARAGSCLCLVPTRVLLHQWRGRLLAAGAGAVGVLGDGQRCVLPLTVTTFESAYRHMAELGNRFEMVLVDEVHHFGGGLRDEALEMCAAPRRLGLTATPPGSGSLGRLRMLIGPVVFEQNLAELCGDFLAEFEVVVLSLPLSAVERRCYERDYAAFVATLRTFKRLFPGGSFGGFVSWAQASREGRRALRAYRRARELLALTDAKHRMIGELLARHASARCMVFTESNRAAYRIAEEYLVSPITCDIGRMEREAVLSAFDRGEIRAVVSARVLNEGVDVPDADVAIIVGGSFGEREHVQRVGRLLRPRPGKRALVYELVGDVPQEERRGNERRRGLLIGQHGGRGGTAERSLPGSDSRLRGEP